MSERKIERVGIGHPECCDGNKGTGPCEYKRVPGSTRCFLHGGAASQMHQDRAELKNLRINNQYAGRARDMTATGNVKTLTDEITIMRITLETIFNSVKSDNDMLIAADKLEKLAKTIGTLTEKWQSLQEKNKELLGRETVMAIFDALMEKIVERVNDPDIVVALAEDGYGIIAKGLGG